MIVPACGEVSGGISCEAQRAAQGHGDGADAPGNAVVAPPEYPPLESPPAPAHDPLAHIARPAFRTMLEAGGRAMILVDAGFDYVGDVRRALRRTRRALSAVRPERVRTRTWPDGGVETTVEAGGAPDWPTRQRAAEHIYMLAGLTDRSRSESEHGDALRPVAVNIIVQGQKPSQGEDVAVRVALNG